MASTARRNVKLFGALSVRCDTTAGAEVVHSASHMAGRAMASVAAWYENGESGHSVAVASEDTRGFYASFAGAAVTGFDEQAVYPLPIRKNPTLPLTSYLFHTRLRALA